MEEKKWKHLGVRIPDKLHAQLFDAMKTSSIKTGINVTVADVVVPAIKEFIKSSK